MLELLAGLQVLTIVLVVYLFTTLIISTCKWIIYIKLGLTGWHAFIPFYGAWKLYVRVCDDMAAMLYILLKGLRIAIQYMGLKLIVVVILYCVLSIPLFALNWYCTYKVAEEFGYGKGFTAGLMFLPIVFYPILAVTAN